MVSSDASHPDVRGVKPSNKRLLQKAKKPPDALRRLFVFRKTPGARTINQQLLTAHASRPTSLPSPLFASAKETQTTTSGTTTARGFCTTRCTRLPSPRNASAAPSAPRTSRPRASVATSFLKISPSRPARRWLPRRWLSPERQRATLLATRPAKRRAFCCRRLSRSQAFGRRSASLGVFSNPTKPCHSERSEESIWMTATRPSHDCPHGSFALLRMTIKFDDLPWLALVGFPPAG